jgi:tRNA-uridine 2-sulfurtransferase
MAASGMEKGTGRVAVAMSGGVDSSVAAALLLEQGHEVFGITMRVWNPSPVPVDPEGSSCKSDSSDHVADARRVADQLGIQLFVVDFQEEFRRLVIEDFVGEYYHGRTPNPCVRCNRTVKFGLLMDKARELGAEYLATGHYARIEPGDDGFFHLLKGDDPRKDQSYFLFALTQEQLSRSLFPLGGLTKPGVRAIASRLGLRLAEKGESQEICFIPDDDYVSFLEAEKGAGLLTGDIVDSRGSVLGSHCGTYRYTVGQRRGLGIAWREPLYVLGVDAQRRKVVVGPKEELYRDGLTAARMNWIMPAPATEFDASCKIRYRHQPVACRVLPLPDNRVEVRFQEREKSVTPGQAVVFYDNDRVLGGGWIEEGL